MPIKFGEYKSASLTLSKLNGHEVIPMRLSAIVKDLPQYLEEILEKIYHEEQKENKKQFEKLKIDEVNQI